MTKPERSWVLYDVGNSAYVLLASTLIPIYFSAIADPNSSAVVAWGYASTVASLVLALLMPFLGSLADLKGNKKKFLAGTIGTGAVTLAVMGIPSDAMVFLVIYVVSSVMLNASQGGGGKGMRLARSEDEVREAFVAARSEAVASFGDGTIYIERFVEEPHHIEF